MHRVLVVDDNFDSCDSMARFLSLMGDKAVCVSSGQAALEYLRHHLPRLVILDLMMPDMDGMEVLRRIRREPRTANLPVVIFSGVSDPNSIIAAKSEGATDFWVKSQIDFSKLHAMVGPYLAEPAAT